MKIMPIVTVNVSDASEVDRFIVVGSASALPNTLHAYTAPMENCRSRAATTIHHRPAVGLWTADSALEDIVVPSLEVRPPADQADTAASATGSRRMTTDLDAGVLLPRAVNPRGTSGLPSGK